MKAKLLSRTLCRAIAWRKVSMYYRHLQTGYSLAVKDARFIDMRQGYTRIFGISGKTHGAIYHGE